MDKWDKVVDTIVKTIDARIRKPSSAYSTEAQVKRIEGQTAYVDIPGGEPNMPARLTIDAKVGDTVQVSVDDHKATLTGNRTAPPTDDTTANEAKDTAEKNKRKVIKLEEQTGLIRQGVEGAQNMARQAEEDAENALTAANGKNTVYYLATQPTGGTYQIGDTWFDTANDNKIYHWNGTAWTASLLGDDALDTFSANHINAGSIDASNVTISNLDAGNITSGYLNAARIETGSLSISKTSGLQSAIDGAKETATDYLQATSTGLKVGKDVGTTSSYSLVTSGGFSTYANNTELFNAGYGSTNDEGSTNNKPYYTLGQRKASSGTYSSSRSYSFGDVVTYGGYDYVYIYTSSSSGHTPSTSSSYWMRAIGAYSVVEGYDCIASNGGAHTEGTYTKATGSDSHAEGYNSRATGKWSHVEGYNSRATAEDAHAQGEGVNAGYTAQTAVGKYNNNKSDTLFEVGNGSSDSSRSNAFEVTSAGKIKVNGSKAPFTTFTATGSTSSISSGSGGHAICTGTVPTGYTIIGIQTVTTNHTFSGAISSMTLLSNGAYIDIINTGSSSQTFSVTATILCTAMQ